jgi:hypothetical protein
MTAIPRPGRPRSLRDDLLDDLRQAAPMPAVLPKPEVPMPAEPADDAPVDDAPVDDVPVPFVSVRPTGRPDPSGPGTPTFELRVTPRLSWGLRLKTLGEGPGFVLGAGPVQISLTGLRR